MQSDNPSFQCQAEFILRYIMGMGMGAGTNQKYGEGIFTIGSESLSFKPHKDPKMKSGRGGAMLKSLVSTNIRIYPHPVMQYRDVKEFKAEKSKALRVYLHAPYSVHSFTGQEVLAMPTAKIAAVLELKFDDGDTRDNVRGQLETKWSPFKRTESEVGFGAISPTHQPVTVTRSVSGDTAGYCTNCGESYAEGQKFCGKCGSTIS
ncbi:MAG: zinc ribbon domain-containing protein [Candidatus Thorarchaeota archaeon]